MDRLAATLILDSPVSDVRLVSPSRARALEALGIHTVRDLVMHYPRRYLDMSSVKSVGEARIGDSCTIKGVVHEIKLKKPKPRLQLVEITLVDDSGTLIITAFRQPWLVDRIKENMTIAVAGTLEFNYGFKRMTNPFIEVIDDGAADKGGVIIPIHPASGKISTAWMRRLISNALELVRGTIDPLPLELRVKYRLMSRQNALSCIHFPTSMAEQAEARRRLAYEELLELELMLMLNAAERSEGAPVARHVVDGPHMKALEAALPFELTSEQLKAKDEILEVLAADRTANHMLLGDVGTGKTIVAAFALAAVSDTGTQALFMAPTEILVRQHAASLGPLFDAAGITWEVLTGSTPASEREAIVARIAAGTIDVTFGTHALLEDDVAPAACTLVVIDEQQRFGVDQRAKLLKKGENPDALFLTATPIPRSLALALYGELTLSYLHEKPHDTAPRKTVVHAKSEQGQAYDAALEALARGEQVYVVCPLVGTSAAETGKKKKRANDAEEEYVYATIKIESDADMGEDNVVAAEAEAEFLQNKVFIDYKVGLLHGQMKSADKQRIMEQFAAGEIDVLVATTIIEVGVDVPNATVMIVEDADRFGLAQLHQLRGRVGRGDKPGEIHLISGTKNKTALARLSAMQRIDDGFELAEYDLSLRREGDILGNRQHGASGLKLVNIVRDGKMVEVAHRDAMQILAADPHLTSEAYRALGREARLAFDVEKAGQGG